MKILCAALPERWTMEIMTTCLTRFFRLFVGDRKGVTALEYGLIATLIALGIMGGVPQLGTKLLTMFNALANSIPIN